MQTADGPDSTSKCACCGSDASTRCLGCLGAPEYQIGDAANTVYCGRDCQKEHWKVHKAQCKILQQRRKILRAAQILKATILTYREATYDLDLKRVHYEGEVLWIHQNQRPMSARAKRGSFPGHLVTNVQHKEAILAHNSCTTAMCLLGRLTRKLLQEIASGIKQMDLQIGKPLFLTRLDPGPDSTECPHTVLVVRRVFSNETWVLDTTGCQYGFQDVLVPYQKYVDDKACSVIHEPITYDATETKDLDFFSTLPFLNVTSTQKADREAERKDRLHFATFVDNLDTEKLLGGSDSDFNNELDSYLQMLRLHMSLSNH